MAETFPTELQDKLNEAGFNHEIGGTSIRSTVAVGLAKVRRRFSKGIDKFSCTIDLEKDDYLILYNFFNTTLGGGVLTFNYDHPLTGVESEFRFIKPPALTPLGGLYFRVSMVWEEIP